MKALIILAALLGSASVYARPCVEGRQQVFTETDPNDSDRQVTVIRTCVNGSYYDLSNYVYNPRTRCEEGRRQVFTEPDPRDSDRNITVVRTCVNGSYYDLSDYVYNPNVRCKEGRRQMFQTDVGDDKMRSILHICVNGKYVRAN